eukprot:368325_1
MLPGLLGHLLGLLGSPPALVGEVALTAANGAQLVVEVLDFVLAAVPGGVVTSRVVGDSVGHGLDEDRGVVLQDHLASTLSGSVDGDGICTIDTNGGHTVTHSTAVDA